MSCCYRRSSGSLGLVVCFSFLFLFFLSCLLSFKCLYLFCLSSTIDGFFYSTFRSNHPKTVILAMETIMTLVIDESEEISAELLTLLLASVKKQNQVCLSSNVSPLHHDLDRFSEIYSTISYTMVPECFSYGMGAWGKSYH